MNAQNVKLIWLTSLLTLVVGCSSRGPVVEPPDVETFPYVECKVLMGDKDVEYAVLELRAKDGKTPKITSQYDADSDTYKFTTTLDSGEKRSGVPEGIYTVAVKPGQMTKTRFSSKFSDPSTSGFTLEVESGPNLPEPFEVTP
jgi:hypothetical protein